MQAKNIVVAVLALVLLGSVGYLLLNSGDSVVIVKNVEAPNDEIIPVEPDNGIDDGVQPLAEIMSAQRSGESIIGTSVTGSSIIAYHFGSGDTEILLVGGIHGGYSWNTAVLGYELVDYFDANPGLVPENVTVTVIPVMNPDGLKATLGTVGRFSTSEALAVSEATRIDGRFNENTVDLNRNFDCEWKEIGTWKNRQVSGGDSPFSEPESAAIRDYVNTNNPAAAVVWFSAEGKVYPSACGGTPSNESVKLAATFATASGYATGAKFDAYAITGDIVNWLADQNIPAISVILTDHKGSEIEKNLAGIKAVLKAYSE